MISISGALAVIEDAGQRNELNNIYKANEKRFYNIALSKLGNQNDAEDAVQEAFLRIADKPENLFAVAESKRVAYIDVIIRNVAFEMYKKQKNSTVSELTEDIIDENPNAEELALSNASKTELADFIMSMPEAKRQAMLLKINHQMSNTQIAHALGISEAAARKRISDAGIMIKNYLNEVRNNG